jgi:hypothetical protein
MWYEWANTNRHQYPSDPSNNWADQALPNFAEKFWTNSYQPFVEYEFHAIPKLTITPGVKFSYYTIGTKQFADDGKTIGNLGTGPVNNPAATRLHHQRRQLLRDAALDRRQLPHPRQLVGYGQVAHRQHRASQQRLRLQPGHQRSRPVSLS